MPRRKSHPAPVEHLIEMTVLTPCDPSITAEVCRITEHLVAQGGHLVVTDSRDDGRFMAGYHFAAEEPGSELAGGAAYGVSETIAGALQDVSAQVGLDQGNPKMFIDAAWFLDPSLDPGDQIQKWLNTTRVKEWLTAEARRRLASPVLAGADQVVRDRWEAFATLPDHGPRA